MIVAHIVGMPNEYKEQLINDLKDFKQLSIVDLDKITQQIISEKNMITLYNKMDEISNNSKGKIATKAKKDIESKINDYWKTKIDTHLLKEVNKGQKIICVGMSTYFKNHKIGIKIITPIKLFIKMNLIENAKKIIKENLDKHHSNIISGTFDLNYLNLDFLIRKREDLQYTYGKMGYQLKSYNDIYKTIQLGMMNITPDALYFAEKLLKNNVEYKELLIGMIYGRKYDKVLDFRTLSHTLSELNDVEYRDEVDDFIDKNLKNNVDLTQLNSIMRISRIKNIKIEVIPKEKNKIKEFVGLYSINEKKPDSETRLAAYINQYEKFEQKKYYKYL